MATRGRPTRQASSSVAGASAAGEEAPDLHDAEQRTKNDGDPPSITATSGKQTPHRTRSSLEEATGNGAEHEDVTIDTANSINIGSGAQRRPPTDTAGDLAHEPTREDSSKRSMTTFSKSSDHSDQTFAKDESVSTPPSESVSAESNFSKKVSGRQGKSSKTARAASFHRSQKKHDGDGFSDEENNSLDYDADQAHSLESEGYAASESEYEGSSKATTTSTRPKGNVKTATTPSRGRKSTDRPSTSIRHDSDHMEVVGTQEKVEDLERSGSVAAEEQVEHREGSLENVRSTRITKRETVRSDATGITAAPTEAAEETTMVNQSGAPQQAEASDDEPISKSKAKSPAQRGSKASTNKPRTTATKNGGKSQTKRSGDKKGGSSIDETDPTKVKSSSYGAQIPPVSEVCSIRLDHDIDPNDTQSMNQQPSWLLTLYGLDRVAPLSVRGIRTKADLESSFVQDCERILSLAKFGVQDTEGSSSSPEPPMSLQSPDPDAAEVPIEECDAVKAGREEAADSMTDGCAHPTNEGAAGPEPSDSLTGQKAPAKAQPQHRPKPRHTSTATLVNRAIELANEMGKTYALDAAAVPTYLPTFATLQRQTLATAFFNVSTLSDYYRCREEKALSLQSPGGMPSKALSSSSKAKKSPEATLKLLEECTDDLAMLSRDYNAIATSPPSGREYDTAVGNSTIWSPSPSVRRRLGDDPRAKARTSLLQFVGLRNLGATCYMAGIFQTLFFNQEFRDMIFRLPFISDQTSQALKSNDEMDSTQARAASELVPGDYLYEMRQLFVQMLLGANKTADPSDLALSFRVRLDIQQDAQEFNSMLLNALEARIPQLLPSLCTKGEDDQAKQYEPTLISICRAIPDNPIRDLFQGTLRSVVVCKECGFESARYETFYEISLRIKGQQSINNCLDTYFEEEELSGHNKYLCTGCKQRVDAARYHSIVRAPKTLNLQLLRFDYDATTGAKVKVRDALYVPHTINLARFCDVGPGKKLRVQSGSTTSAVDDESGGDIKRVKLEDDGNDQFPAATQSTDELSYTLVAVLRHQGTSSEQGHYVCDVLDPVSGLWWFFDDERVFCTGATLQEKSCEEHFAASSKENSLKLTASATNKSLSSPGAESTPFVAADPKTGEDLEPDRGYTDAEPTTLGGDSAESDKSSTTAKIGTKRARPKKATQEGPTSNNQKQLLDLSKIEGPGHRSANAYMLVYRRTSTVTRVTQKDGETSIATKSTISKYHIVSHNPTEQVPKEFCGFAHPVRLPCVTNTEASIHCLQECAIPSSSYRPPPALDFPPDLPSAQASDAARFPGEPSDSGPSPASEPCIIEESPDKMSDGTTHSLNTLQAGFLADNIPLPVCEPVKCAIVDGPHQCTAIYAGPPRSTIEPVLEANERLYSEIRAYQQRLLELDRMILQRRRQVRAFLETAQVRPHSRDVQAEATAIVSSVLSKGDSECEILRRCRWVLDDPTLLQRLNMDEPTPMTAAQSDSMATPICIDGVQITSLEQLLVQEDDLDDAGEEVVERIHHELAEAMLRQQASAGSRSKGGSKKKGEEIETSEGSSDEESDSIPDDLSPPLRYDSAISEDPTAVRVNTTSEIGNQTGDLQKLRRLMVHLVAQELNKIYSEPTCFVDAAWLNKWLLGRTLADDLGTILRKTTRPIANGSNITEGGAAEAAGSSTTTPSEQAEGGTEPSVAADQGVDPVVQEQTDAMADASAKWVDQASGFLPPADSGQGPITSTDIAIANVWKAHHPLWPGSLEAAQKSLLCEHNRLNPFLPPTRYKLISMKAFEILLDSHVDMIMHKDKTKDPAAVRSEVTVITGTDTCLQCAREYHRIAAETRMRSKLHYEILGLLPQRPNSFKADEIAGAWLSKSFIRQFKAAMRAQWNGNGKEALEHGCVPYPPSGNPVPPQFVGTQTAPTRYFHSSDGKWTLVGNTWLHADPNRDLLCTHNNLSSDHKLRMAVSEKCWERIQVAFPQVTVFYPCYKQQDCHECSSGASRIAELEGAEMKVREMAKKNANKLYRLTGLTTTVATSLTTDSNSSSSLQSTPKPYGFNASGLLTQFIPQGVIKYPWFDQVPPLGRYVVLPTAWVERWRLHIDHTSVVHPGHTIDIMPLLCENHLALRLPPYPVNQQPHLYMMSRESIVNLIDEKQNESHAQAAQADPDQGVYVSVPGTWPGAFVLVDEPTFRALEVECVPFPIYVEIKRKLTDQPQFVESIDQLETSKKTEKDEDCIGKYDAQGTDATSTEATEEKTESSGANELASEPLVNETLNPTSEPKDTSDPAGLTDTQALPALDETHASLANGQASEESKVNVADAIQGLSPTSPATVSGKASKSKAAGKPTSWEDVLITTSRPLCIACLRDRAVAEESARSAFEKGSVFVQCVATLELAVAYSVREAANKRAANPTSLIKGISDSPQCTVEHLNDPANDEALASALAVVAAAEESRPTGARRVSARVAARHARGYHGAKAEIPCSGKDTLETLKLKLFSEIDVAPSQQVLVFDGNILKKDSATLESLKIGNEDILYLFCDRDRPYDFVVTDTSSGSSSRSSEAGFSNSIFSAQAQRDSNSSTNTSTTQRQPQESLQQPSQAQKQSPDQTKVEGLICNRCTFENPIDAMSCNMCGGVF